MRILWIAGLALVVSAPALLGAEGGHSESRTLLYRCINFALLAGGLGYLIKKNLGPIFQARSEAIRADIAESQAVLEQSEARARAIEERFSNLGRQIEELRSAAKAEITAEHARLEREAEQAVRKVSARAEQEITAAAKAARLELKAHAASLAIGLAEKKIAGRITPRAQRALVNGFVENLQG